MLLVLISITEVLNTPFKNNCITSGVPDIILCGILFSTNEENLPSCSDKSCNNFELSSVLLDIAHPTL